MVNFATSVSTQNSGSKNAHFIGEVAIPANCHNTIDVARNNPYNVLVYLIANEDGVRFAYRATSRDTPPDLFLVIYQRTITEAGEKQTVIHADGFHIDTRYGKLMENKGGSYCIRIAPISNHSREVEIVGR